ncbi:anti-sigma factor [Listeria booriae]|uniref:Regulator of SigK n=1 Tax=Listeria booriae TaxID=1552123 RepID=A0A841Y615_9LIST|nr:anti-sigma factor [Listeria booriae]MBC1373153.1 anti-sigma factor [Listeria booriae]
MSERDYSAQVLDYINNDLSKEARLEFEAAMERLPELKAEVQELEALMADLPYLSESATPPEDMKERVLGNVFAQEQETVVPNNNNVEKIVNIVPKRKRRWVIPSLVAALIISLAGNFYVIATRDQDTKQATEDTDITKTSKALQASDNVTATATASLIQRGSQNTLVIQAQNLNRLNGAECYQVWLLLDGKPTRAGTFIANDDGHGGVIHSIPTDAKFDTVAITIEPDNDSQTPKGPIILSTSL